jgi:hypothetical protein
LKLSQHPAPQPAARLILLGGLHSVSEAVIFTYSSKISLLSLNQSYPAIIEATAAAAQLVFTCPLFYGFNFAIQGFQNGSTVFSDSVDLAVCESVRLSDNHVTARGGAAIAFYGRELHLIDSNIESNVAHAASKEDSIVGGAILVQVNLAHEASIYNISFHNCNISSTLRPFYAVSPLHDLLTDVIRFPVFQTIKSSPSICQIIFLEEPSVSRKLHTPTVIHIGRP